MKINTFGTEFNKMNDINWEAKKGSSMDTTYIKILLKKETSVTSCLRLIENLRANNLIEDVKVFSNIFSELKINKKEFLLPVQEVLRQRQQETESMLDLFQNRSANDY